MNISVVLYQPEIPPNTGNIGRLCVGFGVPLYLIEPLGFSIDDRELKRAGLDYWPKLNFQLFPNFEEFWQQKILTKSSGNVYCFSTKGKTAVEQLNFQKGDTLLFGSETKGFPVAKSDHYAIERVKLPMKEDIRSYNLANAVAMGLYAAHNSFLSKG